MSQIIDHILSSVCLDERVKDGIFQMEEEQHMNALRDHLVQRGGLTLEDAISVTNRMLEGKYPERQAYRKEDGILVTWPSPKHKQKAMFENPGKYVEENPMPKKEPAPEPEAPKPIVPEPKPIEPEPSSVNQGGQMLAIEPPRGPEKPEAPPEPPVPPVTAPKTPEEIAAQKAVVQQMIKTDDTAITQLHPPPIPENCVKQLRVLREHAISQGLSEASEFLKKYTTA